MKPQLILKQIINVHGSCLLLWPVHTVSAAHRTVPLFELECHVMMRPPTQVFAGYRI